MTQWSVISNARTTEDLQATREGLQLLAMAYWKPLYLYLRKSSESHADASDSVQGFFEHVIGSEFLKYIDREGGKFRSYLLKSLERWRSQEWRRAHAQKRGGGVTHLSREGIDELNALDDLKSDVSPETLFDRQWALEIVDRAVAELGTDYAKRGRETWFEALRPALPGGTGLDASASVAKELQVSDGAVRKAIHDLRQAFTARLKEEIRSTVRTSEDAEEELRYLVEVLAQR